MLSPTDDEIKSALIALRADNPTLGIAKIHALLLSTHPGWTVSEKRTRKTLRAEGLTLSSGSAHPAAIATVTRTLEPSSNLTRGLRVSQWTGKVDVKQFGPGKGKGLVAAIPGDGIIASGEVIWKEDPWVVAPEWDIFDLQWSVPSRACAHCTTPFASTAAAQLITPCPTTTTTTTQTNAQQQRCAARFCNRMCLARAQATHHPLLCPAQSPAGARLVRWARAHEWMAVHALARVVARVLLAFQASSSVSAASAGGEAEMDVVQGWAALGMEERVQCGAFGGVEPDRETWKAAHLLFLDAFRRPSDERERRMLAKTLAKPVPESVYQELFVDYDDAFLVNLGRMSLNMEAHGGLYVLHAHLNHACDPNVSVRHLDTRTALARITAVARRDIRAGEELTIAYVDPAMGVRKRRQALLAWGFGECRCERCVREEAEEEAPERGGEVDELERELKAGLGLT